MNTSEKGEPPLECKLQNKTQRRFTPEPLIWAGNKLRGKIICRLRIPLFLESLDAFFFWFELLLLFRVRFFGFLLAFSSRVVRRFFCGRMLFA